MIFADFCAGIGGFRIGLERLHWKCVYSNEIDEECEQTYKGNFGHGFHSKDIFDIKPKALSYFDVLCAGFPCQPFSIAGKQMGINDPRGRIIYKILEIAEIIKPKVVFMENVPNLFRHNGGSTYKSIKQAFSNIGYTFYEKILDSTYFGIPQSRPRVYMVGILNSLRIESFIFTERITEETPFAPYINHGDNSIPITKKWQEYIDLYTGKKAIEEMAFSVPHTRKALERVNQGTDLDDCIFQIRSSGIRACNINKPLPTFAVSVSGGGAMIPVYSRERRHLNLIEMKRLMGFSDGFNFKVSRTHAIKQLANSVCPSVIESIGRDIANAIQ